MDTSLSGKIALVTGASRGIGEAIAKQLAEQGAFVIGTATCDKGAAHISNYLGTQGKGVVLNLSEQSSIEQLTETLKDQAPDILVCNAGIARDNLLLRMKDEEWSSVINTNLNSVFYLTRWAIKSMLKKRWGRIINISSVSGLLGNPGQTNYAAAKAGLIGFSKSLALELATRSITVNVVAPGFIETDMTKDLATNQEAILKLIPVGTMGKPQDIASAVGFLASPAACYITGEVLKVAGGL